MKITTNFAERRFEPVRPVMAFGLLISVIAAVLSVFWGLEGMAHRRLIPEFQARLATLPALRPKAGDAAAVDIAAAMDLRRRVDVINALPGTGGGEMAMAMYELERMLPDKARLTRLEFRETRHQWRMAAEAADGEVLTKFVLALEASGRFGRVSVKNRLQRAEGSRSRVVHMELVAELPERTR